MRNAECGMQSQMSPITHRPSSVAALRRVDAPRPTPLNPRRAFTLLELLTVIAIMGIIAAISLPTLRGLKPNAKVAATRQLLDAVGRARQLAISQRTTVYMVFVPLNFFSGLTGTNWGRVQALADKQLTGYAYVTLRSVGDQPGEHNPRYVAGSWKTLPKGAFIPPAKFWPGFTMTNTTLGNSLWIAPFPATNTFPFPSEDNPVTVPVALSYIAFDDTGQLVSGPLGQPELIPITEGTVSIPRDPVTKAAILTNVPPLVNELPPGNTLDNYSLIYIDRLTGRAHVERRRVQ
jgi:prepilin-type N-terminal cleavage/methylation domain-containing protein